MIEHGNLTLDYEYLPIPGSGNTVVSARYITKLYLVEQGRRYSLGEWDGKLDEEDIKTRVTEILNTKQERQYGTQRAPLRKELTAIRTRGTQGLRGTQRP